MKSRYALYLILTLCFFGVVPSTHAHATDHIILVGDSTYPPYSYAEDGEPKGIYVRIIREALKELPQYKVELVMQPWKRALAAVARGHAFGVFPPYYHEHRTYLHQYSESLLTEEVFAVCSKEPPHPQIKWPYSHEGMSFAQNQGFSVGGKEFDKLIAAKRIPMARVQSGREGILMVFHGHADCYISDKYSIYWELKGLVSSTKDFEHGIKHETLVGSEDGYIGYRDPGNDSMLRAFIKDFDMVIKQMKQNGVIERIANSYFTE